MPKVSVIIPTYNCSAYLSEAINGVLAQSFQDFEIIIIDDGSTDSTQTLVKSFQEKYPARISYLRQENQGVAIARNTGIEHAIGEYIALLDADDYWTPNHLEEEIKLISADRSIGLVHANITRIDGDGMIIDIPFRDQRYLNGFIFEHLFVRRAHISCSTVLFRKTCIKKCGLFDPYLSRLGCEDRDYWLRIAKDFKVVYIPKELTFYRVLSNSLSRQHDKMIKARLYIIDKYIPANSLNQALRKKALAKVYRDQADEFLISGQPVLARAQYQQSLKYYPFDAFAWINLGKSLLPTKS